MNALRRIGPRPIVVTRFLAHHAISRIRRRLLRRSYQCLVATPAGATLNPPVIDLVSFAALPQPLRPAAERLRVEADMVCQHRVDYLGSGLISLGREIDWHRDFKSGHIWPAEPYFDVKSTRLDDDSDAKVPWELSRGHQLLTLARAAVLFEDERYALELEEQLSSWLDANPPGIGINWVNAMEVALRAVNWIWALATVRRFRSLDSELEHRVVASLQSHGRHIALNLEGSPYLRSNHYLADILGLFALGLTIEQDRAAGRWRRFAHGQLEREIYKQVRPDGIGFEASLSYHGLALEMFLLAAELGDCFGVPFSGAYFRRLGGMLAASRTVRHPSGRTPLFGDGDSGRVLPGGFDRPPTQDPLLWLGAARLGVRPLDGPADPEVCWTLGLTAWQHANALAPGPETVSTAFRDSGVYVLRDDRTNVVVHCGDVGQNGNGGHAHADIGSFELSVDGVTFIVDSGTYAYTFDVAARNAFRSTAAHNIVQVDGRELHPCVHSDVFRLRQGARPTVEDWSAGARPRLDLRHDGWHAVGVEHARRFALRDNLLVVEDELSGDGSHELIWRAYLAPGTSASIRDGAVFIEREAVRLCLRLSGANPELVPARVSDRYGQLEETVMIEAAVDTKLPVTIVACVSQEAAAIERGVAVAAGTTR